MAGSTHKPCGHTEKQRKDWEHAETAWEESRTTINGHLQLPKEYGGLAIYWVSGKEGANLGAMEAFSLGGPSGGGSISETQP